jgi:hypothetical protein
MAATSIDDCKFIVTGIPYFSSILATTHSFNEIIIEPQAQEYCMN